MNSDNFFCFVHIEKCAGSSLHAMLQNNFPLYLPLHPNFRENEYFSVNQLERLLKIKPGIQGIGGHRVRSFLGYELVTKKPIYYFTFLRKPISRYISHVNYQKTTMGIDWDIDGFMDNARYNDFMCFRLSGERDAQKAIEIIKKMDFVGLMEYYDESLLLLNNNLGININYEKINIGEKKSIIYNELTEQQQNRIQENNSQDIILYDYVKKEIFKKYLDNIPGNIQEKLNEFRSTNENFRFNKMKLNFLKYRASLLQKILMPLDKLKR